MIYSMTGYGKCSKNYNNLTIDVEIKSINSRFLDLSLKLPNFLYNKEYEIREIIRQRIKRGKIIVIIQIVRAESNSFGSLNKDLLKEFLTQIKEIKKSAKITDKVKLDHLLSFKDLFYENTFVLSDEDFTNIKNGINTAIDDLFYMKKNEGNELKKDLRARLDKISGKVLEIEAISSESVTAEFHKLQDKVRALINESNLQPERLDTELAIMAEKGDITEETVRLRSHIKFFSESLEKDDEPGRKLNFICQEMQREANTISSKSVSIDIIHNSVLIKEEIEKIREQIQNIE